jgi:acetyl-CoA carboxylase carboxyl transferase subunit alpha
LGVYFPLRISLLSRADARRGKRRFNSQFGSATRRSTRHAVALGGAFSLRNAFVSSPKHSLTFERPIVEMEARLETLRGSANSSEVRDEIQRLRVGLAELTRTVYANLSAWETVEVARHPERPQALDYIDLIFDEFVELHGDKVFGDDRTVRTGWARLDDFRVLVVGQHKGRNFKERQECNFGCAKPEGYRKAVQKMRLAAKFGLPIVTLIDTPGAYPGKDSEERGIAQAIAESMAEMSLLKTPIVSVLIGEGGSGGAIGIGVGDCVAMLQYSYYSVISPEGCAGILWRDRNCKDKAAEALKFTSRDLYRLGIVDDVIEEPLGGAHRDHRMAALNLKKYLRAKLRELAKVPADQLVAARYDRFRKIGVFLEEAADAASGSDLEDEGKPSPDK